MSASQIRSQLAAAVQARGKVDAAAVDQIMIGVEQRGGLADEEKAELLKASDVFDPGAQHRLEQYLGSLVQAAGHVNVAAPDVVSVDGRYAQLNSWVPGITAKVGLFDSVYSLTGTATGPGMISLMLDGKPVSVAVKTGETPADILQHLATHLPNGFAGAVVDGDVRPYDMATFVGRPPGPGDAAHIAFYKPSALQLKPGERPLRVVVTGYGDFMGVTDNPSDRMAEKLSEMGIEGAVVEYQRLDVTPQAVDRFIEEVTVDPPDVVLSMGMAPESQVEELPENRLGGGVDGANQPLPEGLIDPKGPPTIPVDLPVDAINWSLRTAFGNKDQIGTSLSDPNYQPDRSAYLCNYLGYKLAETFTGTKTAAGFVHVTESTPSAQMHVLLESVVAREREKARASAAPVS